MEEKIIDESNFHEHFHDVRFHRPKRGQVMARYSATAEFVNGQLKRDVIDLLAKEGKAEAATRVMRKLGMAVQRDALRVVREMAEDLISGISPEKVEEKPYKYTMEAFYYCDKADVPAGDPHWTVIGLSNLDEFLDAAENRLRIEAKIVDPNAETSPNPPDRHAVPAGPGVVLSSEG